MQDSPSFMCERLTWRWNASWCWNRSRLMISNLHWRVHCGSSISDAMSYCKNLSCDLLRLGRKDGFVFLTTWNCVEWVSGFVFVDCGIQFSNPVTFSLGYVFLFNLFNQPPLWQTTTTCLIVQFCRSTIIFFTHLWSAHLRNHSCVV